MVVTALACLASLATSKAPPQVASEAATVTVDLDGEHPVAEGVVAFRLTTDPGWGGQDASGYLVLDPPSGFRPEAPVRVTITPQALPAMPVVAHYGGSGAGGIALSTVLHDLQLCPDCTRSYRYRVEVLEPHAPPIHAAFTFRGTLSFDFDDERSPTLTHLSVTTAPTAVAAPRGDAITRSVPFTPAPGATTAASYARVTIGEGELGNAYVALVGTGHRSDRLSLMADTAEHDQKDVVPSVPAGSQLVLVDELATCAGRRCTIGLWALSSAGEPAELTLAGAPQGSIDWMTPSATASTDLVEARKAKGSGPVRRAAVVVGSSESDPAHRRGIALIGWADDSDGPFSLRAGAGYLAQHAHDGEARAQVIVAPCAGRGCDARYVLTVNLDEANDPVATFRVGWWAAAFTVDPSSGPAPATTLEIRKS